MKLPLEGKEIGIYFNGTSESSRTLDEFEFYGTLDLVMLGKAMNETNRH